MTARKIVAILVSLILFGGAVALTIVVRRRVARAAAAVPPPLVAAATALDASAPLLSHDYIGVLLPPLMVNVASRIDGKIEAVDVELGRVVPLGGRLASLDHRLEKHNLDMARASYRAARAAAAAARVEVARSHDHASRRKDSIVVGNETLSLVSGEEIAQAKFDENSAAAKLMASSATAAQEQKHVEQESQLVDEHELRAPFDCVVAARYADPGAYVKAGEPIVRIVATGALRARFAVPEQEIASLKLGDALHVALDTQAFDAHVRRISPEVEPSSRTVFVEADTDGTDALCHEGCAGLAGRVVRVSRPTETDAGK